MLQVVELVQEVAVGQHHALYPATPPASFSLTYALCGFGLPAPVQIQNSIIRSLTIHSIVHLLMHSLTYLLTRSFIHSILSYNMNPLQKVRYMQS